MGQSATTYEHIDTNNDMFDNEMTYSLLIHVVVSNNINIKVILKLQQLNQDNLQ